MSPFVNITFLLILSLASRALAEEEENVSEFDIEELQHYIRQVKADYERITSNSPYNIQSNTQTTKNHLDQILNIINNYFEDQGKQGFFDDAEVRICVLNSLEKAIETQKFARLAKMLLEKSCILKMDSQIGGKLEEILDDLENASAEAQELIAKSINYYLWCSNNDDEPECYNFAKGQMQSKALELAVFTESAEKELEEFLAAKTELCENDTRTFVLSLAELIIQIVDLCKSTSN